MHSPRLENAGFPTTEKLTECIVVFTFDKDPIKIFAKSRKMIRMRSDTLGR